MNLPIISIRKADERAIELLYESLPAIACKGLCHECCGPIAATRVELERIRRRDGAVKCSLDGQCTKLDERNRCSVYAVRPLICRLFGLTQAMRCPHGCEPSRWVSDHECASLLRQAANIGGGNMFVPVKVPDELIARCAGDAESLAVVGDMTQKFFEQKIAGARRKYAVGGRS